MRFFYIILCCVMCLRSVSAEAVVSVNEQIMQSGQFLKANCRSDPKTPDYDECLCDADVRYPQLSGVSDETIQAKLNAWFKDGASTVCEGSAVPKPAKDAPQPKEHGSISVHYEVTYSSPQLIAFDFTDWAYTGGAHGNGSVIGIIVDLSKGEFLTPTDIFGKKNMEAVNGVIYDALTAKPEGEIFRDQIEARKDAFIKNGECQGCTLTLTPEGVHVLFQTYEVAPYGAGKTDVLIPIKYVSNKAIVQALATQTQTGPEKK